MLRDRGFFFGERPVITARVHLRNRGQMSEFPKLPLVLGGTSSGKSAFAETLAVDSGLPKTYLATAIAEGAEMQAKIARHKARRDAGWRTVEAQLDLCKPLQNAVRGQVILLDCVSVWLANQMARTPTIAGATDNLCTELSRCEARVIVVSNDVSGSLVPTNEIARDFQRALGELNQRLAIQCDVVVSITAGLPMVLKGQLPDYAP